MQSVGLEQGPRICEEDIPEELISLSPIQAYRKGALQEVSARVVQVRSLPLASYSLLQILTSLH